MFRYLLLIVGLWVLRTQCQFNWQSRDTYDMVRQKMDSVNEDNCHVKFESELRLPSDVISHLPDIKEFEVNPVFPNRTALLHLHNMAMSRAFFFSFILQKAWDDYEPGMMYYFLSVIADVAANPRLNASAIYFSPNMSFSPSYRGFFNKTFPLFAPRAFRSDDFNDPFHLMRVSTWNTIEASDLGAIRRDQVSLNYSDSRYRINEWYNHWLPDHTTRQDSKYVYYVEITYPNSTNVTHSWHGPPGPEESVGPVKWIRPYFDCGRSNKWIAGATSPIPDIYPRHTQYRHIEFPLYAAVASMEMDLDRIDINQCPLGPGNNKDNIFNGTSRCKTDTTECEPLQGFGLRRGGYQCRCKPGYRLPNIVRQPYLGEVVERATKAEHDRGFDCLRVGYGMIMPQYWEHQPSDIRQKYMGQYEFEEFQKMTFPNQQDFYHMIRTNLTKLGIYVRSNETLPYCNLGLGDLEMPGDMNYGAELQFENEARMAVRLSNFLSSFLQIVDPTEQFGELRLADQPLSVDQMYGEAIATAMGDVKIWGAGIFWDRNKFPNHTYFAPYAFKRTLNTKRYQADDLARRKGSDFYANKGWFRHMKNRWATTTDELEEYILKIKIRGNSSGEYSVKYDHYPVRYRAAEVKHGHWTKPYFDCSVLKKWVITYVSPFFGWDSIRNKLEFKGVVAVSVLLEKLDINQCSDTYEVPNAFKGSHKCDTRSSMCIPMLGRGFDAGGYKCECEQGFEFPFEFSVNYFDGQLLEAEFGRLVHRGPTRFDMLQCRIAAASTTSINFYVILLLVVATVIFNFK